jgi:hypothetical protein
MSPIMRFALAPSVAAFVFGLGGLVVLASGATLGGAASLAAGAYFGREAVRAVRLVP